MEAVIIKGPASRNSLINWGGQLIIPASVNIFESQPAQTRPYKLYIVYIWKILTLTPLFTHALTFSFPPPTDAPHLSPTGHAPSSTSRGSLPHGGPEADDSSLPLNTRWAALPGRWRRAMASVWRALAAGAASSATRARTGGGRSEQRGCRCGPARGCGGLFLSQWRLLPLPAATSSSPALLHRQCAPYSPISFGYGRGGRIQWRVAGSLGGPLTYDGCTTVQARSSGGVAGSGGGETDPTGEASGAPSASNGGDGPWMGSVGSWMGSVGLSMSFLFFCFFYAINQGGRTTASEKVVFTVTFHPRRLR